MSLIQTKSFEIAAYIKGDTGSKKLALVLPGRLDTKDYPHMHSHVDYLAERGYLALSFDPPGTWESPGDISLYTMTNYLKAINELIEYFGNRTTLTVGHSRGGSMAMLAAISNSYVTHFIAVLMGGYSYDKKYYEWLPGEEVWKQQGYKVEPRDLPEAPEQIRNFNLPYTFYEDSTQYDMTEGLKNCTKPKLFILGTKDVTVKPVVTRKAFELSAPPKELREIDSDHNYRLNSNLTNEVNVLIGEFLDKHGN